MHSFTVKAIQAAVWLIIGLTFCVLPGYGQTISGAVYRDFNSSGTRETSAVVGAYTETGLPGVVVTAYNAANTAVTSATTNAAGTYSLSTGTGTFRIEFTGLKAGDFESFHGTGNGTTVQFVAGGSTNVNAGVNYPQNYCGPADPKLFVSCYVNGDPLQTGTARTNPVLVSLPFSSSGASPSETGIVSVSTVGAVYGLAVLRSSQKIFSGGFTKRHVGYGPNGAGAIYMTDVATNATTLFTTLNAGTVTGRTLSANKEDPNYDIAAYDAVGKTGLGDLDLADDGKTLYAVNLFDRKLYAIPVTNPANPVAGTPSSVSIINPCAGGSYRPFAVKFYRDKIYVGIVCTKEGLEGTANAYNNSGMTAYVYSYNADLSGTPTLVFSFPLTYQKGATNDGAAALKQWYPWSNNFYAAPYGVPGKAGGNPSYPQPWFTDIEFDVDGSMVLGIRDRFGDQTGDNNYGPKLTDGNKYRSIANGDILRAGACGAGGAYVLESNGAVCGLTSAGTVGNAEGPGGGEFYSDNVFCCHNESSDGSLALLPGHNLVINTSMDPVDPNLFAGGLRFFNNTNGSVSRSTQIYSDANGSFGKANGLGDIELDCNAAPIEIGNRVWNDVNANGRQDANEVGLAGVAVQLYLGNTLVATATTNSAGEYYFNTSNVSGGVQQQTAYQIRVPLSSTVLTGRALSPANNAGTEIDSDGTLANTSSVVSLTTGSYGQNKDSFDFGFYQTASLGNFVWNDLNGDGLQTGEPGIDGVTVTLVSNGSAVATTTTAGGGLYSFTGLTPGVPYSVSFTTPTGFSATLANQGGNDAIDSNPVGGITAPVTLTAGENNLTLDAGFTLIPVYDLSLAKTVLSSSPYYPGSGQVTFQLTVTNSSNVPVYNVVLNDVLPAGILFVNGSGFATSGANSVSALLSGPIAVSGTQSLTLTVSIGSSYTATTLVNTAAITKFTATTNPNGPTPTDTNPANNTATASVPIGMLAALGNFVWEDLNANGQQDNGEPGIVGVTVSLVQNNSVIATTTTGAGGIYSFTGLTPGVAYQVQFGAPAGYSATVANVGNDAFDSDRDPLTGRSGNYTLASGETNDTVDAGFFKPATLGDQIFVDLDGDGIQNNGETGLGGVIVTLIVNGSVVATATTNPDGTYSFTGLTPGVPYSVSFTAPAGYTATTPPSGVSGSVTLTSGQTNNTLDAGFQPRYELSLAKTVLSSGPYFPGGSITYRLTVTNNSVLPAYNVALSDQLPAGVIFVSGTGFTSSGVNSVSALLSGPVAGAGGTTSLTLTVSIGNGYAVNSVVNTAAITRFTATTAINGPVGVDTNPANNTATASVPVSMLASLGDQTFIDTNGDGIQNNGELPVGGVIITLISNGSVVATTISNANGIYSFTGLTPGVPYSVSFTAPTGYTASTYPGGVTAPVTLTSGQNNTTLDAGFVRLLTTYALTKTVNLKQIEKGQIVTYTVSLTNTSGTTANSLVLTDKLSSSAITLIGSATVSAGTFAPGANGGTWSLSSLAGGQVATLTLKVQLNEEGIIYNTITLPGQQTATTCVSIPAHVCTNEHFQFDLTAPASYSTYQWSHNGTPIAGATSATYSVTAVGEYTVATTSMGGCPDGSCCPFIVVADPAPSLTALAVSGQCVGQQPQANAAITLVGSSTGAVSYNITKGSSFSTATPLFTTPRNLSAVVDGVLLGGQPAPAVAQDYTIRVYSANGCFSDSVVSIQPTVCACPPVACAPFVVRKTKAQGKLIAP